MLKITHLLICVGALFVSADLAWSADPKSAAAQPPTRPDADYFLQGEYSGTVSLPGRGSHTIGLQVVARGNGQFAAMEYLGGLPGNGWDLQTRHSFSGERTSADRAKFFDENRQITVNRNEAIVRDAAGHELGRLLKQIRRSPTLGAAPPADATVLFCGRDARMFDSGLVTPDHFLVAGSNTSEPFGDFTMHLEFRTPYMPEARDQGRGNSGVYIQGRYEVQILDSFGLRGEFNECGSLYRQRAPLLNMCFPPLTWQTYDIDFQGPQFDSAGQKIRNGRITVRHNGVVIHDQAEITAKTGAGKPEGPEPLPIKLQDHGNPVHFRNIWIVSKPRKS
ncbi:MAG: DUF1080 domain-containing protein [Planctomycetes bacterium]|nr:DUF1080 domain-containing protein [Planctomycetota bacterium]